MNGAEQFAEGFASWRRMLAAVSEAEARLQIFMEAATNVASYINDGLARTLVADELADMAAAHLADLPDDQVQSFIADAITRAEKSAKAKGNGQAEAKSLSLLPLINIRAWHDTKPKPRQWLIEGCIPDRNVTLLTGQGGVGKTLIIQQLSVATVLGRGGWFDLDPKFGPVLFITAEDDEDEMHLRYDAIARYYKTTFNELAELGLHLQSLAGRDAAMAITDNRGIVRPTALWHTLVRTAQAIKPRWIGLDTAADIFLVNERDRAEVRQCISLLRGLALDINTCIILLAHPSLTGISSGTGLSGSTAWHNSVRSRLYLKTERTKKKEDDDDLGEEQAPDLAGTRVLSFMKSNYSALAQDIRLEWKDGLFHKEGGIRGLSEPERAALSNRARDLFCQMLKRFNNQNFAVSPKERANNFVVTQMVDAPEVMPLHEKKDVRRQLLEKAFKSLLASGDLFVKPGPEGLPPSKQRECLYIGKRLF
jgi:RecA-family ATPase